MKAYRITVLVIDFEGMSAQEVAGTIEHQKYPNWCISPTPLKVEEADIGQWRDDHPLNLKGSEQVAMGLEWKEVKGAG